MTVLHSLLAAGGLACQVDDVMDSILDHTMWLQLTAGEGLGADRILAADGRHVVSVVQEGLLRLRGP